MKHETMKILEEWRKELLRPMDGITITRDFQLTENQAIELLWFVHSNNNSIKCVKHNT